MDPHAALIGIQSLQQLGQTVLDGIILGGRYALVAVPIALILGVTGRFHFAFSATFTLAAYVMAVMTGDSGIAWPLAAAAGVLAAAALGVAIEGGLYRPLEIRAKGNAILPVFVAALGVTIIVENGIQLIWGSGNRSLDAFPEQPVRFLGLGMTTVDVVIIGTAAVAAVGMQLLLSRTGLGRQIKAVRTNLDMSRTVGIDPRRVFLIVFAIGSAIGGLGGMLDGMKFAVQPEMGNTPLLYGFVAAFLAGTTSSPIRVALAAILVGLVQNLSTLWVTQQVSIIAVFALLIAFLSYKSLLIALSRYSESPLQALHRALGGSRRAAATTPAARQ
jgi:branched-subunit amino acid ABC-type transport system permease component